MAFGSEREVWKVLGGASSCRHSDSLPELGGEEEEQVTGPEKTLRSGVVMLEAYLSISEMDGPFK